MEPFRVKKQTELLAECGRFGLWLTLLISVLRACVESGGLWRGG